MASTRQTYARLWRNRAFRGLLLAHFTSNFGDWLAFMALFHLAAIEWQSSILGIGCITVSYLLPFAVIAPLAGVYVDRWELRRLMMVSDVLRAGILIGMIFADHLAVLCALVFLHQSVSTFFNPAQHAAIPRLVDEDDILAANALSTQASHLTKVLGPGIGGVLVATLGTRGCLLLDAGTFLLSAVLLRALPRLYATRQPADHQSVALDLRGAWASLAAQPRLRWALASLVFSVAALGAFLVALPIHARDALHLGARGMGLLLSLLGVGTLLGAGMLVAARRHTDRLQLMGIGSVLLAVGLVALMSFDRIAVAAPVVLVLGIGTAVLVVPAHAVFQEETHVDERGRILSLALALLAFAQVSGMGLSALVGRSQPAATALGMAAALAACSAVVLWSGQRWRNLRRPAVTPTADPAIRAGDPG